MTLAPGACLGPYEITAAIGAGGMGEVYRATDTTLGREVAIKVLPEAFARDPDRLARFEREARVLASLNHPAIAHVYGFESATLPDGSSAHFLAMELVEGEDLAERLKRGAIPVDEALPIARQIAEALEEAHEKGIVHRDLKPANVKITPDGEAKVLDFGLAKAFSGDAASGSPPDLSESPTLAHAGTAAGLILGTAAYMSPEQARGRVVDKRSDIWAFGVVLFEMLSGNPVFAGDTVSDVLAAVLKEAPPWDELPAGLPGGVLRVLARCLVTDPRDRLHDIADARLELQDPTPEEAATAVASASSPGRSWRQLAVGLLWALGGLALGASAAWLRPAPRPFSALRFTLTPAGPGGRVKSLRVFPDGRSFVYSLSSERRLLVHDLDDFDSRPIPGTEGAVRPFVSADGRSIGFFQGGKLRRIGLEGGDPTDICDVAEDTPGASWGPGNVILFSPAWTNVGLWRVDAAGGPAVELTKPDRAKGETGHFWADFLPDGRAALFTIFGGRGLVDSKVGLLDLASGRYQALFEGAAPVYLDSGHVLYYRGGAYRTVPFDARRRRVDGPESTVLPGARRLNPVGSAESYVAFARGGLLAYVEADSILDAPLSRLAWVSRDGFLEELPFEAYHVDLSLSPDGARAAVSRFDRGQLQVYLYDLKRGTSELLTLEGQNWAPTWHPGGRHLAITSQLKGNFDVRRSSADGTSAPEPLLRTDLDEGDWRWAPDGESAVFGVWSPVSGKDLWRAKGDGSEPLPLLASPSSEDDASFSPDGKWIAYRAGEALYVTAYPSLGPRVLIAPIASFPRWSRTELIYVEEGRLKAASYDTSAGVFRPSAPATLFTLGRLRPPFDVAPDGRRFIFLAQSPGQPDRDVVRVVLDGFRELRKGSPDR